MKDICLSHVCEKDDTKCGISPCACNGEKRVGFATFGPAALPRPMIERYVGDVQQ